MIYLFYCVSAVFYWQITCFLVTVSRITSISIIAYLFPHWTILACVIHIIVMAFLIQLFDPSPFCAHYKLADVAFSFALGAVYLFTYILPVEGKTRYRYAMYYSVCFLENIACGTVWYLYASEVVRFSVYFYPITVLTILPFLVGIVLMILYYLCCHPKLTIEHTHVVYEKGDGDHFVAVVRK